MLRALVVAIVSSPMSVDYSFRRLAVYSPQSACLKVCRSDRRLSSTVRFLGLFSVHDHAPVNQFLAAQTSLSRSVVGQNVMCM